MNVKRCTFFLLIMFFGFGSFIGAQYLMSGKALPFFKGILKNHQRVGAFAPCSTFVALEVTKYVDACRGNVRILEVGGGTGQFTETLEKKLNTLVASGNLTSYILDVVEIDAEFCEVLREKFKENENVRIHCIDVALLDTTEPYDCIISSVPFTNIPLNVVQAILKKYEMCIKEDGIISYIELMLMGRIKRAFTWGETKQELIQKQKLIAKFKNNHLLETVKIWCNITPAYVHHLKIKK